MPPDWLKSSAIATTYGCVGYGSYLVWRDFGGFQGDAVLPLTCYGANLALSWTFMPVLSKTQSLGVVSIYHIYLRREHEMFLFLEIKAHDVNIVRVVISTKIAYIFFFSVNGLYRDD